VHGVFSFLDGLKQRPERPLGEVAAARSLFLFSLEFFPLKGGGFPFPS